MYLFLFLAFISIPWAAVLAVWSAWSDITIMRLVAVGFVWSILCFPLWYPVFMFAERKLASSPRPVD